MTVPELDRVIIEKTDELQRLTKFEKNRNFLKPVLIGFFIGRENKKRIQTLNSELCDAINQKCNNIEKQVTEFLKTEKFLNTSEKKDLMKSIDELQYAIINISKCLDHNLPKIKETEKKLLDLKEGINRYNKNYIDIRKKAYNYLWNKGSFTLDEEQQTAVITDDKYNLVVAAAGSGKTEVLTTRIAYLIKRKPDSVIPDRILAIAYQKKASEEIENRLLNRYGIRNTNVSTFHKLGKNILEQARSKYQHTDVVDENKKHEILEKLFIHKFENDKEFYFKFLTFSKIVLSTEKDEDETARDDALEYSKKRCYYSINNVKVKSKAEEEIIDFFLTHTLNDKSIWIKYEPDVSGFRPDFYLPDYDVYIEHWALNKKGEVPKWFSQTSEDYKKSMEMKKKWFNEHNYTLIETFAYEYNEKHPEEFIELLKNKLKRVLSDRDKTRFDFSRKSYSKIVELAWKSQQTPIEDCMTFITTAKSFGLTPDKVKDRFKDKNWSKKQLAFAELVLPLFYDYEKILKKYDKIDFEDMINSAILELEKNPQLRSNSYDHILIDEYQDISAQRFKLIKKLLDRNPRCKLFCVGDDWQSIMAFSGSNINFFVKFGEYFKDPTISIISTNYRSNKTIVNAGSTLIKNNTSCQIQKPTKSKSTNEKAINVISIQTNNQYSYELHMVTDCIDRIVSYLKMGYDPEEILVLTRFMRTKIKSRYKFLETIKLFIQSANNRGLELACGNARSKSKVRLLTVHKSKGLEAKVVFLLNLTKGSYGFPSEIENSDVFEIARINYPLQKQLEEERRLFYVAITRAKEDLHIYTWEPRTSAFLDEVKDYTNTSLFDASNR